MTRAPLLLTLLSLLMLLGCEPAAVDSPPGPSARVDSPSPTPAATCRLVGSVVDPEGQPLEGVTLRGLASEALDARRSRTVGEQERRSEADGSFAMDLPCGASVGLEAGGFAVLNPPMALRSTPDAAPVVLRLAPKLKARLSVVDDAGRALPAEFESARDGRRQAVPTEGLRVWGMEAASPAGVLHVPGFPPRPWTFERSDVLERDHDGDFEATVVFGDSAARWLHLGKHHKEVKGAWCLDAGQRGERCVLEPSALRCPCAGPVAVAGPWDVAWVLPLSGAETVPPPPVVAERCLPGDRARPAGIDGGLVLEASYAPGGCIQSVQGQALEARVAGRWVGVP